MFLSAEPVYAFTFLLTLIILCIYTIFVLTGRMFDDREKRIALLCAVTVGILSSAEFTGAYIDFAGVGLKTLQTAVKFLELSLTPGLPYAMGMIMSARRPVRFVLLPIGLSIALQAVMLPFRLVFYVDEAGVYHHGSFYWVYPALIIISAVYLCGVFFVQARKLQSRHSFYCVLSVMIPLICLLAHIFVPEIRMSWLGVSIALIFMYSAHCSVKLCTDHITHLLDRSTFDADLQTMKKGNTLLFFDINKFKQLNDDHGHIVGDEYLSTTYVPEEMTPYEITVQTAKTEEEFAQMVAAGQNPDIPVRKFLMVKEFAKNPEARMPVRTFITGDSFMLGMVPYVFDAFPETEAYSRYYLDMDAVLEMKPEVFIYEIAERYVSELDIIPGYNTAALAE